MNWTLAIKFELIFGNVMAKMRLEMLPIFHSSTVAMQELRHPWRPLQNFDYFHSFKIFFETLNVSTRGTKSNWVRKLFIAVNLIANTLVNSSALHIIHIDIYYILTELQFRPIKNYDMFANQTQ